MQRNGFATLVCVLVLSGCSSSPQPSASGAVAASSSAATATISQTGTATPANALVVVGIGDSYMSTQNTKGQSFMDLYAASLERTLARPVQLVMLASDNATTDSVRNSLAADDSFRAKVAGADVIVISVGGNDSDPFGKYPKGTCAPDGNLQSCLKTYSPRFAANYEAILSNVATLRDGKPTLVRITSADNPFVGWAEAPTASFGKVFYAQVAEAQTTTVCALATRHAAKCIDYLHVFGGKDGLTDPAPYLADDHAHPGDKGIETIANLLSESGTQGVS